MGLSPISKSANRAPGVNGTTEHTRINSERTLITLKERISSADNATFLTLTQKFPARSRLISAQLKWSTTLAVDGTNGTNGTADTVALVKIAPSSLTTNTTGTTETIVQGSTTKTANTSSLDLRPVNAAEWVNETTADETVYLVPFDPNGAQTFDTITGGYLFDGVNTIDVEMQFEQTRELLDT